MTKPVNLNKARKAKAKAEKEQRAKENRAKFGRTGIEKKRDSLRAEKMDRAIDAHRLSEPHKKDG